MEAIGLKEIDTALTLSLCHDFVVVVDDLPNIVSSQKGILKVFLLDEAIWHLRLMV